jgi:putative ABC transport system permease protein
VTLPLLVAIALGIAAYQMIRRPMLRRLAMRDTLRRRGETILVIAGGLLGTAIITGSFIVGDTLDASVRATATTQLGPVDETITVTDPARAAAIQSSIEAIDDSRIDGVASLTRAPASISIVQGNDTKAEPDARLVELDFEDARDFGGDPSLTGIKGPTPGDGEVAVTEDLAEVLGAKVGDRVQVALYGEDTELSVVQVLPRLGLAGFWTGIESTSANAFVAPGTISSLVGDEVPVGTIPPSTTVLVSNRGGIEDGAELSDEVAELIASAIADPTVQIETAKEDRLESATAQGDSFSEFFLAIGSFAVVAGILLLVQIFVMLSEERKTQLGMLRAVGMRRSDLMRSFYMQGALYALPSGVLGSVLGIGVGYAIVKVAAPIFGGSGDFSIDLTFSMDPQSIIIGFCVGVIIALLTVAGTSLRISRINIIRAIRDLQEPERPQARLRTILAGLAFAVLGAVMFAGGLADEDAWPGILLGPPIAAFGLLPSLSRFLPRRVVMIATAAFALAWGIFGDSVTGGRVFESGDIFAFVIQGVLLNVSAVVLLSQTQENLGAVMHRIAPRSLSLRLGLAYPLARRFRTGLTLGMFSLVIFTMVFISVLSNVFGGQIETTLAREAGGFDILVDSLATDPPDPDEIAGTDGVSEVASLLHGGADFIPAGGGEAVAWPVSGIDQTFVMTGPPSLEEAAEEFGDDEGAVWEEVLRDPTKAVVPVFFLQAGGGGPPEGIVQLGDVITMRNPINGTEVEREVIGLTSNDFAFSGALMSHESLEPLEGVVSPSRFFVVAEGGDAAASDTAVRLQGELVSNGVEAQTFRNLVEEFQTLNLQFFRLMQGYLALGLLVGIAGIGVVMVRAVRERRRQVGVLRSLGFLPSQVRRAFVLESAFTALEGILVGTSLALVTAYQLIQTDQFGDGIVFEIPWREVGILMAVALVASLLATAWPARQASQIPPAVALRIAD